jgi:dihydropteroate synthase
MLTLEYLAELLETNRAAAGARVKEFALAGQNFRFNSRPALMGVINLSADSWYRESVCLDAEQAVQRGRILHAQGAQIIDLGAESSLAHASRVDEASQQSKLIPVLRELRKENILVSVETYHLTVTRACLEAGANVLNLTGTQGTSEIYRMVADHDAAVIICFVQGANVREVTDLDFKGDFLSVLHEFFSREIEKASAQGLEKIFIDPGMGFYYRNLQDGAERVRYQIKTLLNTFRLRTLGFPICHALPHGFEYFGEEVRSAEPFFGLLAALGKTDLFRTHEVPKTKAVLDTLNVF